MCDPLHNFSGFFFVFWELVLQDEVASKRQDNTLKDVDRSLAAKKEYEVTQKLLLILSGLHLLFHCLHFWRVLEFLINHIVFFVLLNHFSNVLLHLANRACLVDVFFHRNVFLLHRVGQADVRK